MANTEDAFCETLLASCLAAADIALRRFVFGEVSWSLEKMCLSISTRLKGHTSGVLAANQALLVKPRPLFVELGSCYRCFLTVLEESHSKQTPSFYGPMEKSTCCPEGLRRRLFERQLLAVELLGFDLGDRARHERDVQAHCTLASKPDWRTVYGELR